MAVGKVCVAAGGQAALTTDDVNLRNAGDASRKVVHNLVVECCVAPGAAIPAEGRRHFICFFGK